MKCTHCGYAVPPGARFCDHCGGALPQAAGAQQRPARPAAPRRHDRRAMLWTVAALLVAGAAAAALLVFAGKHPEPERRAEPQAPDAGATAALEQARQAEQDAPDADVTALYARAAADPQVRTQVLDLLVPRLLIGGPEQRRRAAAILAVAVPDWPDSPSARAVVPAMIQAAGMDQDPDLQLEAIALLGRVRDASAIGPLSRVWLEDGPAAEAAGAAINAIDPRWRSSPAAAQAVEAYLASLDEAEQPGPTRRPLRRRGPWWQVLSEQRLAQLKNISAAATLRGVLRLAGRTPLQAHDAAGTLAGIDANWPSSAEARGMIGWLAEGLGGQHGCDSRAAAHLLARIADPAARAALIQGIADKQLGLRMEVLAELKESCPQWTADPQARQALPALHAALLKERYYDSDGLIEILQAIDDPESLRVFIQSYERAGFGGTLRQKAYAAAKAMGTASPELLVKLQVTDASDTVSTIAKSIQAEIGRSGGVAPPSDREKTIQVLLGTLASPDAAVRAAAARKLLQYDDASVTGALIEATAAKDADARERLIEVLGSSRQARFYPALLRLAIDADAATRRAAEGALFSKTYLPSEHYGFYGTAAPDWGRAIEGPVRDALAAAVAHADPGVRLAAVRVLGCSAGSATPEPLYAGLKDADSRVRAEAVRLLARWQAGDAKAAAATAGMLLDADAEVRRAAFESLPLEGRPGYTQYRVIPADMAAKLVERLKHPDAAIRRFAVIVLSNMKVCPDRQAVAGLIRDPDAEVRLAVVRAAGRWPRAEAGEVARPALKDEDDNVRETALLLLAGQRDAEAIRALTGVLPTTDDLTGERIVGLLADSKSLEVFVALLRAGEGDGRTAAAARSSISGFKADSAVLEAAFDALPGVTNPDLAESIKWLLDKTEGAYRSDAARKALGRLQTRLAGLGPEPPPRRDLFGDTTGPSLRKILQAAIKEIGMPASLDDMAEAFATAADDKTRSELLSRMAKEYGSRAYEPLTKALKDKSPRMRSYAAKLIGEQAMEPRFVGPLCDLLIDPDDDVRNAAYTALRMNRLMVPPEYVEKILPTLEKDLDGPDEDIRLMVMWTMSVIDDPRTVPMILKALVDSESFVRSEATYRLLEKKSDPRVVDGLIAAMGDPRYEEQERAVQMLQQMDPRWRERPAVGKAIAAVLARLAGPSDDPRASVAGVKTLDVIHSRWASREEAAAAVPALAAALKRPAQADRRNAAYVLGFIATSQQTDPILAAVRDQEEAVVLSAVRGMGASGEPDRKKALEGLADHKSTAVRTLVQRFLEQGGPRL